jgi:O-antigen ligase
MAQTRPLLGVGPDNFRRLYGPYAGVEAWNQNIYSNNLYLEWFATTGLLGLLAFLWFAWRLGRAVWRGAWGERSGSDAVWQAALAAGLLAWFSHGLLDYFYAFTPTYVACWLIVALALRTSEFQARAGTHHQLH